MESKAGQIEIVKKQLDSCSRRKGARTPLQSAALRVPKVLIAVCWVCGLCVCVWCVCVVCVYAYYLIVYVCVCV